MGNVILHAVFREFSFDGLIRAASSGSLRIAALDHEAVNNTVESQPVIEMLLCQLHKVGNADRRCIRIQFHLDGAVILHFNFRMVDADKGL